MLGTSRSILRDRHLSHKRFSESLKPVRSLEAAQYRDQAQPGRWAKLRQALGRQGQGESIRQNCLGSAALTCEKPKYTGDVEEVKRVQRELGLVEEHEDKRRG